MERILNNLGLCQRAGGLISGEEMVIEGIQAKKVYLVYLASDASLNTKKKIKDKASYYNVEVNESYTSEQLSHSIGKINRMVLGVTNPGFLKILKK